MTTWKFSKQVIAAVSGVLMMSTAAMAELTVGFSGPLSGSQAVVGQDQLDGFLLGVAMRGGKLGGEKVKVLTADDQLKPEVGMQIVRQFIQRDHVDALVGLGYSNIVVANLPRLKESGVVAIATGAGPSQMAGADCGANVFSVSFQNDGFGEAIGKLMQDRGYKNVYLMTSNYQAGKDMLVGFKRFYKGKIAAEIYTQVGQTDYSAEITQLQNSGADALFMFYTGGMGVNFTKQLSQAGVIGKLPVYSTFTVDGANLPALRDAAVGVVSGNMWAATLDNPANKKFIKAFQEKYKRLPSAYAANGYDAAAILDVAVAKVAGKVDDRAAFAKAVHDAGARIDSVRGPFRFNNNNFPIQNYYAFEITENQGKFQSKLIATPLKEHVDAYAKLCPL